MVLVYATALFLILYSTVVPLDNNPVQLIQINLSIFLTIISTTDIQNLILRSFAHKYCVSPVV